MWWWTSCLQGSAEPDLEDYVTGERRGRGEGGRMGAHWRVIVWWSKVIPKVEIQEVSNSKLWRKLVLS